MAIGQLFIIWAISLTSHLAQRDAIAARLAQPFGETRDQNDAVVLVEVDKINDLKKAYPNYFGDVGLFHRQLRQIVLGGVAAEYTRPPRQKATKRLEEPRGDLSWLRGTRPPGPSEKKMKIKKRR